MFHELHWENNFFLSICFYLGQLMYMYVILADSYLKHVYNKVGYDP